MSEEKLDLDKCISRLSVHPEFGYILNDILQQRETAISRMVGAPTETIQQISGAIIAYDELLKAYEADKIIKRHLDSF